LTSETYAVGGDESQLTTPGGIILMAVSALAAILVLLALIYAAGTNARHQAAMAAAGCVPSLFISGLPCTTEPMMASRYTSIETPAEQQLHADMAEYTASEARNLSAATAALTAEVTTEQAFASNLATATFTPQNRATADALITNAVSNEGASTVPLAAVTFTPQITVIANALIQADQSLANLTTEQARSSSLTKMRSFNHRVQLAAAAVQKEMTLVRTAVDAPLPGS
jgi:hypothetical protein